jgi:hypothetical protein
MAKIRWFFLSVALVMLSLAWAQDNTTQSVIGGSYTLAAGETLNADLSAIGAEVTLEAGSRLNGHVTVIGGKLNVDGAVSNGVHVYGGELVLGDQARIEGMVSTNWAAFNRSPHAVVTGPVQVGSTTAIQFALPEASRVPVEYYARVAQPDNPIGVLPRSLGLALLAALLMLLLPRPLTRVQEAMVTHPWGSAVAGFGAALAAVVALVLLAVTIIGIPLALVGAFLVYAAVLFGWVALGAYFGKYLESYFKQTWSEVVRAAIGTFALAFVVLALGYLPLVGALVQFGLSLVALGAITLTRFGTRPYQPTPAGPQVPSTPQPQV